MTFNAQQYFTRFNISTHTLTWSVTCRFAVFYCIWIISTHTLTWSVTFSSPQKQAYLRFQLTRSRGAWRVAFWAFAIRRNFNSHAHVERDVRLEMLNLYYSQFQLTRSRGAWLLQLLLMFRINIFQLTRSRGAWLHTLPFFENWVPISTHTLTWSVTVNKNHTSDFINISTHTLTWSVTSDRYHWHYFRQFQLTRSRGAWQHFLLGAGYPWEFQLTRSRGAWLKTLVWFVTLIRISTHTLTWSVTKDFLRYAIGKIISTHTLTWSVTH